MTAIGPKQRRAVEAFVKEFQKATGDGVLQIQNRLPLHKTEAAKVMEKLDDALGSFEDATAQAEFVALATKMISGASFREFAPLGMPYHRTARAVMLEKLEHAAPPDTAGKELIDWANLSSSRQE